MRTMAQGFAIRLAFIAFAAASLQGMLAGATAESTLKTAIVALGVFFAAGYLLGDLARRLVEEAVQAERGRERTAAG